jgi:glycosyltransferase involved in cell wall biosynthesis
MSPLLIVLGGGSWLSKACSGVDVLSGLWDSGWDYRVVGRLSALLTTEGVTAAIVLGRDACGFWARIACARAGVPVVQSLHMGRFGLSTHPKRVAWHCANTALDAWTSAFVCVSEDQARFMKSAGLSRRKVIVIPNGVRVSNRNCDADGVGHARRALSLQADDQVLGMISRFSPDKRQDLVVRAFADLSSRFPRARLVFIGDGPTRQTVTRLAEALRLADKVLFAGSRDDVPALLPGLDILVHATNTESFGMVVLEAMAAGIPVVAARCGGLPEIVVDGVTGLLVSPGSAEALRDAVSLLLEDPERALAMGAAGRARAEADYSVDRMVESYARLLEAVGQSMSR